MRACERAGRSRAPLAGLLVAGCVAAVLAPLGPAAPASAQDQCGQPGQTVKEMSWAQLALDAPSVWPFTTGAGVVVGVVDTGVDASAPQLAGHVSTGTNAAKSGSGDTDCVGHGTEMAGIIAAQSATSVGFRGIAPGATILPIAATTQIDDEQTSGNDGPPDPKVLAKGIRYAVDHGAGVVNVSIVVHKDNAELRSAVAYAVGKGVVVVAAVGDQPDASKTPTPYPASYDGVIGVGAVGPDDTVQQGTAAGPFVDLVAPGVTVTTTARGHGLTEVTGTDIATASVSATVALMLARWHTITPAEVTRRLEATASPTAGPASGPVYGYGMVNPYRAMTETMADGAPHALPAYRAVHPKAADVTRKKVWDRSGRLAFLIAALGLLLTLVVVGAALAIPRGRRRRWHPSLATPPHDRPEDDLPSPPVGLFEKQQG